MFNSLNNPQQLASPATGGAKLHAAVTVLKTAFAEILDNNNYINADINDPYVSFALNLYSKYNNDLDFRNTMSFPIQLLPQLANNNIATSNPTSPAIGGGIGLVQQLQPFDNTLLFNQHDIPYLYPEEKPYLFSLFPAFPYLPLSSFSPDLLSDDAEFERLCFVGSALLEYIIKISIYRKSPKETPGQILQTVKSIINATSLQILCQAYNINFNYKFIGSSAPPYKLFLAYFGIYYNQKIKSNSDGSSQEWSILFKWIEQLLGYVDETSEDNKIKFSPKTETATMGSTGKYTADVSHPKDQTDPEKESVFKYLRHEKPTKNNNFDAQELIKSVQQDFNQSVCGSVEITYRLDEHPNLKTGMFSCVFIIDGEEISNASAMNKKLAKSGAALFAAIDKTILKSIKRSYHDYWIKKYITTENLIRRCISLDPRFEYSLDSDNLSVDSKSNSGTNYDSDDGAKVSSIGSPIPYVESIEERERNHERNKVILSTAKEKVYAYYNSKFSIVPKYEFKRLGVQEFEAKLYLGNKLASTAVASSKKDASAKAAMKVIEQNLDAF